MEKAFENIDVIDDRFRSIFEFYSKKLYYYALNFLSYESEAEDVVQEVFIRFWKSENYVSLDKNIIKTYLFNSVRNACLNKLNKKDLLKQPLDILNYEIIEEELVAFDDNLYEEVQLAVNELPPQTQKIITAIFQKNMKYQEVADELGISVNTVKTLLKNGMKRLRDRFSDRFDLIMLVLFKTTGFF